MCILSLYPWRSQRCVFPVICVSTEISTLCIPCDMCIHGDLNHVYSLGYVYPWRSQCCVLPVICVSKEISTMCIIWDTVFVSMENLTLCIPLICVYPWRSQCCVFPVIWVSLEISMLCIPCDMCIPGSMLCIPCDMGIPGDLNAVFSL